MTRILAALAATALVLVGGTAAYASPLPRVGTEHGYAVRPHRITIGETAPAHLYIKRWQYWRDSSARSVHATFTYDNCIPACANGRQVSQHARVYLSRVRSHHFTRMYISGRADGTRIGTYHWTQGYWEY